VLVLDHPLVRVLDFQLVQVLGCLLVLELAFLWVQVLDQSLAPLLVLCWERLSAYPLVLESDLQWAPVLEHLWADPLAPELGLLLELE